MRIYLDNCCFNRPFDDQGELRIRLETGAKLDVQRRIAIGDFELVWSYVLDLENAANPFDERREVVAAWKTEAIFDVEETTYVLELARKVQGYGVKSKDSLHIACAISANCEVFLSTDDVILRKRNIISQIRILNPATFITDDNP